MAKDDALPAVVVEAVKTGKAVLWGEFRRGTTVEFTGKGNKVYHQAKCTVETDSGTLTVVDFLADEVDWKNYKWPFQQGQMVMVVFRKLEEESGVQVASGKLVAT